MNTIKGTKKTVVEISELPWGKGIYSQQQKKGTMGKREKKKEYIFGKRERQERRFHYWLVIKKLIRTKTQKDEWDWGGA